MEQKKSSKISICIGMSQFEPFHSFLHAKSMLTENKMDFLAFWWIPSADPQTTTIPPESNGCKNRRQTGHEAEADVGSI